jgi:hypothetical protein
VHRALMIIAVGWALGTCGGAPAPGARDLAGRWALAGLFTNTAEISGSEPGCGDAVPGGHLAFDVTITPGPGDEAIIHLEGPGCAVRALWRDGRYAARDAPCVLDPDGFDRELGVGSVLYRTLTVDAATRRWEYELEMTWPSSRFPSGVAKVCGRGQAGLTRRAPIGEAP